MNKIDQLFKEWQKLQPLKPEDQKRLDDKFRLEFNFNSNHIEGNTLTYGQTKLLLVFGETTGDAKMQDYEEMKAHNVGLRWIEDIAQDKTHQLSEKEIRDLNKIILVEDHYKIQNGNRNRINVGVYKTRPNLVYTVTGEELRYASPEETPAMMTDFVSWINKEISEGTMSPIELAALAHYRYIRIHPFEDGNGRISRLLVTYVLKRFGYPIVIIKSEDKENYLRALRQSDINVGLTPSDGANATLEDIEPFVEYMKKQLEWSLDVSIKAAKGENIDEIGDFEKKLTLLKRELGDSANETIQIKYGEQAIKNALENGLFPLLLAWEEKLKLFETLFLRNNVLFKVSKPMRTTEGKANNITALISEIKRAKEVFDSNSVSVSAYFYGFRGFKKDMSVLGGFAQIAFHPNAYEITVFGSETKINKLYHQGISTDEINMLVEILGNRFISTIEQVKDAEK